MSYKPWLALGSRPRRLRGKLAASIRFSRMSDVDLGMFQDMPEVQQIREVLRLATTNLSAGKLDKTVLLATACISALADNPIRDYSVSFI